MSRSSRRTHRVAAVAVVLAVAAAACSSGDSALVAGDDTTTVPTTAAPGGDSDGTSGDGSEGTGDTGSDTGPDTTPPSTAAATTTTTPLDALPACPVEALDGADGSVEITFWHGLNADNEESLQLITDNYNASQDRVRVVLQNQGGYLETIDKYFQSSAGSRPDVVMFPEYALQQAIDSDSLIPAGACIEASGFDPAVLQPAILRAYATTGVQWGMPFNVSNPILYYNRKMFVEAGLDPESSPQSLEELRQFSQQLVDSGAASYGLAIDSGLDSGGGWFLEQWIANAGELYADNQNGRDAPATQVLFDGPTGVELLTFLQQMIDDGLAFYVGDNAGGSDSFLKLADPAEPAAMTIGTSAALGTVVNALGAGLVEGLTTDDIGVGPLPGPSGTPSANVGGAATYVVAERGDEAAAAAWDFITYLVSPEVQAEWTVLTGYLPVRDDALALEPAASKFAEDPRYRVAYDQLVATGDVAAAGPLLGPHRQIRAGTASAVAAIFSGADVATSLAEAASAANALLADYNARN